FLACIHGRIHTKWFELNPCGPRSWETFLRIDLKLIPGSAYEQSPLPPIPETFLSVQASDVWSWSNRVGSCIAGAA
ncbi:MAG TPA: hypothetical protein VGZ47_08785, partial [Gemmataceae bacterium]|nr:hypothetical protein [Gemmataceae bacterium]